MVFRASFLPELKNGTPILFRGVCCYLSRLSPVTKKLARNNHRVWRAQILSVLRGAQVSSFIHPMAKPPEAFLPPKGDDKKEPPMPNPEFKTWMAKD